MKLSAKGTVWITIILSLNIFFDVINTNSCSENHASNFWFNFERYGALINLLYDKRHVFLLVEHISVKEMPYAWSDHSLFFSMYHMLYYKRSRHSKEYLYSLRSSWTLFAQFLSAWYGIYTISWHIILTGSSFCLSRIFLRIQAASFQFHTE